MLFRLIPIVVAALALTPAPALADTVVTGPPDGAAFTGATFAASGTASSETGVTLVCAQHSSSGWSYSALTGGTALPVSNGSWSAAAVGVPYGKNPCRLLALPAGVAFPAPSVEPQPAYQGPVLRFAALVGVAYSTGAQKDYGADLGGTSATARVGSIGVSGLRTELVAPGPSQGALVFFSTNLVPTLAPGSDTGTGSGRVLGLQVDGVNTWLSGTWADAGGDSLPFNGYANLPTVGAALGLAGDGALTVAESDTLRRCTATDPSQYPLGGFTCQNSLVDPGVHINVTTSASPAGTVVRRDWTLTSTDGVAHAVKLVLRENVASSSGANQREWRIGDGAYAQRAPGSVVTSELPATVPYSIAVRRAGGPDPDPTDGLGSLTLSTLPTDLRFTGSRQLTASYDLAVPASGARRLAFIYGSEDNQAASDADAAAARSALRPAVTIDTPAEGARTSAAVVAVTGTARDAVSLTLNGQAVAVAGDGKWTATAALAAGANTLEAVAVNEFGASASARRGVVRGDVPVAPGGTDPGALRPLSAPAAPTLVRKGKLRLKRGRLTLGYSVRCPGAGPACTVRVSLVPKAKRKPALGRATVTVPAGRTLALSVRVKARRPALARSKPTLTVRLERASLTPRTVSVRLKL